MDINKRLKEFIDIKQGEISKEADLVKDTDKDKINYLIGKNDLLGELIKFIYRS
ncbi:MAG: hypothetical protein ACRC7S_14070 [Cetobacterium sp.]